MSWLLQILLLFLSFISVIGNTHMSYLFVFWIFYSNFCLVAFHIGNLLSTFLIIRVNFELFWNNSVILNNGSKSSLISIPLFFDLQHFIFFLMRIKFYFNKILISLLRVSICSGMLCTLFLMRKLSIFIVVILNCQSDISNISFHIWFWFWHLLCFFQTVFFIFQYGMQFVLESWTSLRLR